MKVFLRISIVLMALATAMVVLTVFELKDNHIAYRPAHYNNQPIDNNSNSNR
jgi:hypothetical protein